MSGIVGEKLREQKCTAQSLPLTLGHVKWVLIICYRAHLANGPSLMWLFFTLSMVLACIDDYVCACALSDGVAFALVPSAFIRGN